MCILGAYLLSAYTTAVFVTFKYNLLEEYRSSGFVIQLSVFVCFFLISWWRLCRKDETCNKYQKHTCACRSVLPYCRTLLSLFGTPVLHQLQAETVKFRQCRRVFERFQYYFVRLLLAFWPVTNLSELADSAGRDIFVSSANTSIAFAVSVIRS